MKKNVCQHNERTEIELQEVLAAQRITSEKVTARLLDKDDLYDSLVGTSYTNETQALLKCAAILLILNKQARLRILRYLLDVEGENT